MRKVVLKEFGGPEQLIVETAEDLHPGPGQILVDVEAAGINYLDLTQRSGASRVHLIELPTVLGLEGVGSVRALGDGVAASSGLKVGARVSWMDARGSYASQAVVPAERAIQIPDNFTISEGLLFQALTAHYLVHEYRDIQPGDRVLIHAAAGGLGQLLVQWFKHLGAWVVGTTSSDRKAEIIRALGADAVIVYGDDYDFVDQLAKLTDGKGVDLAIDSLGEKTLLKTITTLARGGTVVAIGSASGPIPMVNPTVLTLRGLRLAGGSVFSYVADPAELQKRASDVIAAVQAGWLKLDEATGYPLDRTADAHQDIENRRAKGKLYLVP
ncbi:MULTISPECIES: quinone oxidoreductase family protein [unclassified Rhizobium]|uniref:quinone oxidoreductase family protein n=1 Tax=unclassified Rhizobium TaxID=2613769 RepID=UPI0007F09E15|nr:MULTISPECIES: quinone oxidoreductase [unclassified Rhizobium]ANK85500.1 Zn-dependent alcohol dehydrogenase GroES-like protein [Rhizobium sp. N731]ANL15747.1 Zn-dependent alcohol dehydrogenase GroES-like protein [Rhizobium sp. N1314]